jgi:hypothetical protein
VGALNWNPHGHIPPGVYDTPHFDVHFYLEPIENVFAIQTGPCGPERVRCDQFALARQPVPAGHVPPDFKDVEAVAPAMGNHLIDVTASEFHGVPFTRTWIYGVYAGRVTFYEEMVTVKYLESRPDRCFPIKSPAMVAQSGYYPTRSCIRFDAKRSEYLVALEPREPEPPRVDAALRAAGASLVLLPESVRDDELARELADADLLLMCYRRIDARAIAGATRLRAIVKYGVGIDAIDIDAARTRAIPVVNVPFYAEETVAEGAFALLLALFKRFKPVYQAMQAQGWIWPGAMAGP